MFFIQPETVLPALKPFICEEGIPYLMDADYVTIIDADGEHPVKIEELSFDRSQFNMPSRDDPGNCVFTNLGTDQQMIAKCDTMVLGIYSKSLGPATYGECLDHITNHK